jgi:transposase-like protein
MEVARMTDEEARSRFRAVRFAENSGEPFCPHCGSLGFYEIKTRHIFKCKGCLKQFSLTSGTMFDDRKMSIRDILMAIAIFVNGASGVSALRLSRDLRCNYRTAYVLTQKFREVLGVLQAPHKLTGIVEIDGKWVGGHVKKANRVADRKGPPKGERKRHPKQRSIVSMRERRPGGRTRSFVFHGEHEAITTIIAYVHEQAKVRTDDAGHWIQLKRYFPDFETVNHSKEGYVINGIHTNWVESFNGRIARGIKGVYHKISGPYLQAYADEFAWREDHRRVSNGKQFSILLSAAARHPASQKWRGYWQRHLREEAA